LPGMINPERVRMLNNAQSADAGAGDDDER
jgi:hypothetical protein